MRSIDAQVNQLIVNPREQRHGHRGQPRSRFPDVTSNTVTTTLDTLTLGGTVWNDNGAGGGTAGNGIKDGTEAGRQRRRSSPCSPTPAALPGVWDATDVQLADQHDRGRRQLQLHRARAGRLHRPRRPGQLRRRRQRLAARSAGLAGHRARADRSRQQRRQRRQRRARAGQPAYSNAITLAYNTEPTAGHRQLTSTPRSISASSRPTRSRR